MMNTRRNLMTPRYDRMPEDARLIAPKAVHCAQRCATLKARVYFLRVLEQTH